MSSIPTMAENSLPPQNFQGAISFATAPRANETPTQGINVAQGGVTPGHGNSGNAILNVASPPAQQQAQTMGALVPLFIQPLFAQNSLQQQLQQNNTQAMLQSLLNPQNNVVAPVPTVYVGQPAQPYTTPAPTLQAQPQNPQAEAFQNLMKLTTQQAPVQATNNPQLNMIQNLLNFNSAQQQQQSSTMATAPVPQQNAPTSTEMAQFQQPMVPLQAQNLLASQQTPAPIEMAAPGFPQPAPPTYTTVVQPAPAIMLQNLLQMNTAGVPVQGVFANPQNPALLFNNTNLAQPQQHMVQHPNQLMMQNLLSQMAMANPAMNPGLPNQQVIGMPMAQIPSAIVGQTIPSNGAAQMLSAPPPPIPIGGRRNRLPMPIFMDFDEETLTEYQCLLRKQIELFEAGPEDVKASAQGRNNPILLGQMGIRCRHCTQLPIKCRPRGAIYYSRTIDGLYQVAQNMSKLHFCKTCNQIPPNTRARLSTLQKVNRRAAGGKEYWSEGLRVLGVYEDGNVMRFRHMALGDSNNKSNNADTTTTPTIKADPGSPAVSASQPPEGATL